ncbi:MAG TPA: hypothetical protein VGA70_06485 [Longimicrobiales bacterium]|jgi:hypothetical protein
METLVAMTMGTILVMLASTLFLVQNDFYSFLVRRAEVQDNARAVAELISSELRAVVPGGVVVADSGQVVVRTPILLAMVCEKQGVNLVVHIPGGDDDVESDDVAGFALWDATDRDWTFHSATWNSMQRGAGNAAMRCAAAGADTVGAFDEFSRLGNLEATAGTPIDIGDILMIYREVEFSLDTSALDPSKTALYTGNYGEDLVEFATGLSPATYLEYRKGSDVYYKRLTSELDAIDGIRIVSVAQAPAEGGGQEDITFTLNVETALLNAR